MDKPVCSERIAPHRFILHRVEQFHVVEEEKQSHLFNEDLKLQRGKNSTGKMCS